MLPLSLVTLMGMPGLQTEGSASNLHMIKLEMPWMKLSTLDICPLHTPRSFFSTQSSLPGLMKERKLSHTPR